MLRAKPPIATVAFPDPRWIRAVQRRLLKWYARNARKLPWRGTHDPYRVWISEIMLQQTQVKTVKPYYRRFLAALPNVRALAAAPEEKVLRLWEGLGYYRRARQLHRAARAIVAEHGGRFPRDPVAVRRLPGIGRYTAGAIHSIAFDLRTPILEANTVRLFSRLLALQSDPHGTAGQRVLWEFATTILPKNEAGKFNQALMELGSLVCTPREPRCEECPLFELCPTRRLGLQHAIPRPKKKPQFEAVREAAFAIERNGKVLLRQCGPDERWAGLWDFPRFVSLNAQDQSQHVAELLQTTSLTVRVNDLLATFKHGVTRFRITLSCYSAEVSSGRLCTNGQLLRWVKLSELDAYPLNTTGRKLAKLLVSRAVEA